MHRKSMAMLMLCVPLALTVTPASAEPTFIMNCYNNKFSVPVSLYGTDDKGIGKASSAVVQLNINTPVKAGSHVLFVNKDNLGVCEIEVSHGYRLEGGEAVIDPTNIFTGVDSTQQVSGGPEAGTIKRYITGLSPTRVAVNKLKFAIGRTTDLYVGTINVTFFVNYVKTTN